MLTRLSCFIVILILSFGFPFYKSVRAESGLRVPNLLSNNPSTHRAARKARQDLSQAKGLEEPVGTIKLGQALALALMRNPELAAFSWEVRIAEAKRLQAGLIPNPEFETVIENFGGSSDQRSFNASETTLQLTQLIELGGKRSKRVTVADFETERAEWDFKARRMGVLAKTAKAFLRVEAAQKRLSLSERIFSLTSQVRRVVQNSIAAGRVSPMDGTQATIQVTTSKIDLDRAKRDLQVARQNLAASWGSANPKFVSVEGDFGAVTPIPALGQLLARISDNPDLNGSKTKMNLRRAEMALERSQNVPDLSLSLGVRRLEEVHDTVFTAGVSVPLPLFGMKNPGGVLGARYKQAQSQQQYRAVELRITTELRAAYNNLSSSYRETVTLANGVIPAARQVFDATQRGYRDGKIGLLRVLDAQRTLFEARGRHIDAAETYHVAKIDVDRLIGGPIEAQTPVMEKRR